jgi:hypothetical protein
MNREVSEKMWISDYNEELTEYIENARLYLDLLNIKFIVENR